MIVIGVLHTQHEWRDRCAGRSYTGSEIPSEWRYQAQQGYIFSAGLAGTLSLIALLQTG
jgi:hypothetical protein